jgi:hypothetical protein
MAKRATPEFDLHRQVVAWLPLVMPKGSLWHHSPNEGKHKVQYRRKLSLMGVCAGWPDLQFVVPFSHYLDGQRQVDIYVELKAAKGRVSPVQQAVIERLRAAHRHVEVCRSLDEVQQFLGGIIRLRGVA